MRLDALMLKKVAPLWCAIALPISVFPIWKSNEIHKQGYKRHDAVYF
jgi:hypothetical protein